MENHHFQWENPLSLTIFNSYVKLPEGSFGGTPGSWFCIFGAPNHLLPGPAPENPVLPEVVAHLKRQHALQLCEAASLKPVV
jgi:hypothetical protein